MQVAPTFLVTISVSAVTDSMVMEKSAMVREPWHCSSKGTDLERVYQQVNVVGIVGSWYMR